MVSLKPYIQHLKSSADLITTYEAIRAGFVALALEKNRQATPAAIEKKMAIEIWSQLEDGTLENAAVRFV